MNEDQITIDKTKLAEHLAEAELNNEAINDYVIKYNRKPTSDELFAYMFVQDGNHDLDGNPTWTFNSKYRVQYNELIDDFRGLIEDFKI